jgi:hypothetical protein
MLGCSKLEEKRRELLSMEGPGGRWLPKIHLFQSRKHPQSLVPTMIGNRNCALHGMSALVGNHIMHPSSRATYNFLDSATPFPDSTYLFEPNNSRSRATLLSSATWIRRPSGIGHMKLSCSRILPDLWPDHVQPQFLSSAHPNRFSTIAVAL